MVEQTKDIPTTESHSREAVEEESYEETNDQEATREFAETLKQNITGHWNSLSTSGRRKYIGASVLTALAISAGIGSMSESESQQEQSEDNTPVTDEVGADSIFPGVSEEKEGRSFDFGSSQTDERAETGEENTERDVTKAEDSEEIITKEVITEPNGAEITKEWYSPYSYTKTVFHPKRDEKPQETYQESSSEPLAPIDHPVYEHITGISYEEFLSDVKEMTPEIGGKPYDAKDVLKNNYLRDDAVFRRKDPRYIETISVPGSASYQRQHQTFQRILEEDIDILPLVEDLSIDVGTIARKESTSGEVDKYMDDLNVSRSEAFTIEYEMTQTQIQSDGTAGEEEVDFGYRQDQFVRRHVDGISERLGGEIFLVQESRRLSEE